MFKSERAPGFVFSALNKAYDLHLTRRLQSVGLTAIQWSLLDQLFQHEGINQRELAQYCKKDPSSLTKTVDIMEKKGLLERRPDSHDRRAFSLYLTDEGRSTRDKAYRIAADFYEIATQGMTQAQIDQIYELSMMIYNNIQHIED